MPPSGAIVTAGTKNARCSCRKRGKDKEVSGNADGSGDDGRARRGAALAANLVGDDGPNRLVETAENDLLRGRGGNDVLVGGGDSDRLFGGDGNDVINAVDPGSPDSDRVVCGAGFDREIVDPGTEDVVADSCERGAAR